MLRVIIVGGGLGGLTCAIACRQHGLDVVLLERAPQFAAIGAGIQVPPNASRVMKHLGLLEVLAEKAVLLDHLDLLRYQDGSLLLRRPVDEKRMVEMYGAPWIVVHREDYHSILLNEATLSGVQVTLGASVKEVNFDRTEVVLENGLVISGEVIIGADGLWSTTRNQILGHPSPPTETGDLAYRATFAKEQLQNLKDPRIDELCKKLAATIWLGPDSHCVFYPVRGGSVFNLVLLRPDDLPAGVSKAAGDLAEMREALVKWDEILTKIVSCIPSVLKWKLCHHDELETWSKGSIAILGDASHPTLPYQAQGAAMAVEDGAVVGRLLGRLGTELPAKSWQSEIPSVLQLYETLRKKRTTLNVQGAVANRIMYHLPDGPEQRKRDADFKNVDWIHPSPWKYADPAYQAELLGWDVLDSCNQEFDLWKKERALNGASLGTARDLQGK
ncbi:putative salicylate hydroxylase [Cadophora sp. MPI-SDFR-AT-0126]|nr:putative salicylate hydroxylase [Leotiomycetes sp. MPI-SDFR-AT-0126]